MRKTMLVLLITLMALMTLASVGSLSFAQSNLQQSTSDKAAKCEKRASDKCAWLGMGSMRYYNCWASKYVDCIRG